MKWYPDSPKEWVSKLALYYRTARHLRPSQVAWRTINAVRSRTPASRSLASAVDVHLAPNTSELSNALLARLDGDASMACAHRVMNGEFLFLNESHAFEAMPDWATEDASRLWRFHLNYFDYAPALAAASVWTGETCYRDRLVDLMRDWIRHATASKDAWHPYPTSLRICNWIFALILLAGDDLGIDRGVAGESLGSLYAQARFLASHLELDLRGNHLFENARALYVSSRAFSSSEGTQWAGKGRRLLLAQLSEQIRLDGGHFENSPTYHCAVLAGVLDCLLLTPQVDEVLFEELAGTARRMLRFLDRICYEDGTYPLFNDSAPGLAPSPSVLRRYAAAVLGDESILHPKPSTPSKLGSILMPQSGYAVLSAFETRIVIDGGELGPDYQPAHGHCDTLSYELRRSGRRIVVDSGVYGYEADEMRGYCRGTAAHNTVQVDAQEQSEIWGAFRVGRRARTEQVSIGQGASYIAFDGRHTGYRRLRGRVVHRRRIVLLKCGTAVVVHDELLGTGKHRFASYVHLAPALKLKTSRCCVTALGAPEAIIMLPYGPLLVGSQRGWFCPDMGERAGNDVAVMQGTAALPVVFGYVIVFGHGVGETPRVEWEDDCGILALYLQKHQSRIDIRITDDGVAIADGGGDN